VSQSSTDWTRWRTVWRADEYPPTVLHAALRDRVYRYRRRLILTVAMEIVVTVAVLLLVAARVRAQTDFATLMWAAWAVAFTVTVWVFATVNRRGLVAPLAETTEAFLDINRRRAEGRLRAVRFIVVVTAIQGAFTGAWLAWRYGIDPGAWPATAVHACVLLGLLVAAITTWCVWQRRQSLRDLALTRRLREALSEQPAGTEVER